MRILVELIEKAEDTMEEVEWYAEKAHSLRATHKELADTYIELAETHIEIYKKLHKEMVELIEEERQKGIQPPAGMIEMWNFQHERLVKDFSELKYLVEEYHNPS